jgi:4-hydroxybenzoate polyprenyltransferase
MRRLLPYAQLVRLPNTFTAMADIFLGALATGFLASRGSWVWNRLFAADKSNLTTLWQELQSWLVLFCLLIASTLLYWSGMIWNDYFDVTQDRKERPNRPLACGNVPMRTAFLLAVGFQVAALLLAALADLFSSPTVDGALVLRFRSLPIAVLLVLAIFLYDGLFKATFAGPILMGTCRFLNILLGLSILGVWAPPWGWLVAIVIGIYIAGVTWFARTEAQASSQPVLIAAAIVMLVSLLLALAVPAVALEARDAEFHPSRFFPYLLAIFGGYLGIAVLRAIRRPDPLRVQPVIKRAVLGLVILDALLASAFVGSFGLLLVVLLIPGIILGRWLYST